MSSSNVLFFLLQLIGPVVAVSSSNWVVCWAGLELSFIGLIPLLFIGNKYVSFTKESCINYFCIQALGSGLLLYAGLVFFSESFSDLTSLVLLGGLAINLGVFPLHFWVPSVVSGLDLVPIFIMLTLQNIAPLCLTSILISSPGLDLSFLILALSGLTALVGGILGNNQTDLRAMLGSSSVAHSGWLLLGIYVGNFWLYFFVYCFSLLLVFFLLKSSSFSTEAGLGLISLSGLPPFMIFIGKWSILKSGVEVGLPISFFLLFLLSAVLSLIFYLKFSYSFILNSGASNEIYSIKSSGFYFVFFNVFSFLFFFLC